MPCCSRKKTAGIEPQPIRSDSSLKKVPTLPSTKSPSEIEYLITIKTGDNRDSRTNGPVYLKIFGRDDKQTKDILLSGSFEEDSIEKIQVKAIDIGKPQRIIIRHEDKTNRWFIAYLEISVHHFLIRFVANRYLTETQHDRQLFVELFGSEQPAVDYNIEIRTGNEQIEPLDSPVYMQIYGSTARTPKLFLESKDTLFARDSIGKFHVSSNNVGEIQKIVIGHENLGAINDWYLENVKIQTTGQEHEFTANQWLSPTKGDQKLSIELIPESSPRTPSPVLFETYFITGKTVDVHHTDAIDHMQISIVGSDGRIDKILIKQFLKSDEEKIFLKGNVDQFEIQEKDIGNVIESITIGFDDHEQKAALLLEFIDIRYKNTVYHFPMACWLSSRLGPNFSWMTVQSNIDNQTDVHYQVIIETGESDMDSNVILCIYGVEGTTKNLALRSTKDGLQARFDKDSRLEFDLTAIDVGKITKINIGYDEPDNKQQWFLKSIEIQKNDEHYLFQAARWFNEEMGTFSDLFPEEPKALSLEQDQVIYTITIVTNSENDSGTDSGVFMTIYGDKNQTKQFQLVTTKQDSELLFKPGEINEFQIELNDVGNINKINIGQDGKGLHPIWHLETVQIQKGSQIFKFHADQVLDYSIPDIDLTPIATDQSKSSTPRSTSSKKEIKTNVEETTYQVSTWFRSLYKTSTDKKATLYLIIVGNNGQTKKLVLSNEKNGANEFTTTDVGKISKILLGQERNPHGVTWYVDHVKIRRGNETTTFNVQHSIEQDSEIEVVPSSLHQSSERSTIVVKRKDINYEIKTTTGEKSFDGNVIIKLRGDSGLISIPLSQSESGDKLFQSKANDVFTSLTTDIGKIKRLIVEINATRSNQEWFLKKIQIIKGNEIYNFHANVHLDAKQQKVTLYPITKRKEDYVQSELRRLRENLRSESAKMRRPPHKAHEPFVYNDLSPYFDTTTVEKAIHEPLETPPGYYTRLTALRIVEPWEAYGMDYGVSYELLKHRGSRGRSSKRSAKKLDESIDRTQGSTHFPEVPCVNIQPPMKFQRPLTLNDVPGIRSFVRTRSAAKSTVRLKKDYKRTRDDFYRMQLDNVAGYHASNRENMIRTYHSYLQNTAGSKKALRDLCDQIPLNATKTTIQGTV